MFYRTFVEFLPESTPVTVGFEVVKPSLLDRIRGFEKVFMHSGNWWHLSDSARSPQNLYRSYLKLKSTCHVDAIMSINVPPKIFGGRYDIWNYPRKVRWSALEESLRRSMKLMELVKGEVPVYCCYEIGTFNDAIEWYGRAREAGFQFYGAGFAAFIMGRPSLEAFKHIIDVVVGAKHVLGFEAPFHASGIGSLKLLAILYYLGVTSADGSTPIRAALSYGFVYDEKGRSYRVRDLKKWSCRCEFCSQYSGSELIKMFKEDYRSRVLHNSYLWDLVLSEMVEASREGKLEKFISNLIGDSRIMVKVYDYAREMKRKCLES